MAYSLFHTLYNSHLFMPLSLTLHSIVSLLFVLLSIYCPSCLQLISCLFWCPLAISWNCCYHLFHWCEYCYSSYYPLYVSDLKSGYLRQLAVDSFIVLPVHTAIRLLVTSNDVIHSFALPSLALKVDAIPGRLNLTGLFINRTGIFYGQCSELCGVLHGFMPIAARERECI